MRGVMVFQEAGWQRQKPQSGLECLELERGWLGRRLPLVERTESLECRLLVSRLYPLGNGEPQKVCEQKSKMDLGTLSLTGSDAHRPYPKQPFRLPAHGPGHSWGLPDSVSLESTGAPLSCAQGPLGGRKQCIVMLASRTSCSDPGARQVFVKTLRREPCAAWPW